MHKLLDELRCKLQGAGCQYLKIIDVCQSMSWYTNLLSSTHNNSLQSSTIVSKCEHLKYYIASLLRK